MKKMHRIVFVSFITVALNSVHAQQEISAHNNDFSYKHKLLLRTNNRANLSPSNQQNAKVRRGHGFCAEEMKALYARFEKNNTALQKILGEEVSLQNTPLIGVCCSGGGNRAALVALGLYKGLEKIGVLDCVTYMASLSGSTWSTAAWLTHNYPFEKLEDYLRYKLKNSLSCDTIDEEAITMELVSKIFSGRPVTLNDIWGGLIANIYLDNGQNNNGLKSYLADLTPKVDKGQFPLPIFTALVDNTDPYEWAEFTPFEIGSPYLNTWIKPWAFGKQFDNGISTDTMREETLGYMLGLFGSAYALSLKDIMSFVTDFFQDHYYLTIPSMCYSWLTSFWWGQQRISPPKVYNFCRNLDDAPFSNKKRLTFVDAGLNMNIPMPPLLRRGINLYIICDAGSDALYAGNHTLKVAAEYAQRNGIPFPQNIDYNLVVKEKISVIADENDPTLPMIIYIPNRFYVSLLDFDYSEEEFSGLLTGIESVVLKNEDAIKSAIKLSIDRLGSITKHHESINQLQPIIYAQA